MKMLQALLYFWLYISCGNCYFYPFGMAKEEKPHLYFTLPDFGNLYSNFFNKNMDSIKIEPQKQMAHVIVNNVDSLFNSLVNFYTENVDPYVAKIDFLDDFKVFLLRLSSMIIQRIPFLKIEEKIRSDGKHYIALIGGSLLFYLIVYVYVTKKLAQYYRLKIRRQYLANVKKVFGTRTD